MRGRDIPACLKARKVADGGRRLGWPKRILDGPRACVGMSVGACAQMGCQARHFGRACSARRLVLPLRVP